MLTKNGRFQVAILQGPKRREAPALYNKTHAVVGSNSLLGPLQDLSCARETSKIETMPDFNAGRPKKSNSPSWTWGGALKHHYNSLNELLDEPQQKEDPGMVVPKDEIGKNYWNATDSRPKNSGRKRLDFEWTSKDDSEEIDEEDRNPCGHGSGSATWFMCVSSRRTGKNRTPKKIIISPSFTQKKINQTLNQGSSCPEAQKNFSKRLKKIMANHKQSVPNSQSASPNVNVEMKHPRVIRHRPIMTNLWKQHHLISPHNVVISITNQWITQQE